MIVFLSLLVWLYLFFLHGGYWRSTPELAVAVPSETPDVDVVVPARDEAETIAAVIQSLLAQDYAGRFNVILVDDNSSDGTAQLAGAAPHLKIISGRPKPPGWSGKLWALSQGVAAGQAPLVLFTDADIVHDPRHLASLVSHLIDGRLDMASEMVRLNCESRAERALVPAFVYFFQMLYPFAKVNDPQSRVAAAAGGTVLIRRDTLERIGGVEIIREALIDDVNLACAVKGGGGAVFLGHSGLATSIRRYPHFADIWAMISRTAFTQLRYSAWLLAMTLLGLTLVWWVPLVATVFGHGWSRGCGVAAFTLAAASFVPTLARYHRNRFMGLLLPLIALFYMAATLGSALCHWSGGGARWKTRVYGESAK